MLGQLRGIWTTLTCLSIYSFMFPFRSATRSLMITMLASYHPSILTVLCEACCNQFSHGSRPRGFPTQAVHMTPQRASI
ncbi:hypothetical protein M438DRAFT_40697 [Aureobasidium pullulans EXF-150]|uniref:Uncharacterized protein n=1 Tax=Aureobasidium pullulans EXF-150 TaxID=1043002 RepID=A0A074XH91_AURPU|nr:uncharacterized protein M438DRAFT_40697 [Aureobasidium pullulans EXF-150]KEQ83059.1 hypothetical protein M438DRAFT_40697 [Aureobasidium pullulans EXF-150]